MTYIPSVHKVQLAQEAVYGDGTAGAIQPPGIVDLRIEPKVESEQLIDKRGKTMPVEAFVTRRHAEGMIGGFVNYQEFHYYLDSMFGLATPAANVSTWIANIDWINVVEQAITEKSLSLRYGQTGLLYLVEGILPYELVISGGDGVLKFSYRFFGRPSEDGASFAGISDDVVEWAFSHHSVFYLDAGLAAAPGTTPMTDLGFRWEARITSNRKPVWHANNLEHDSWVNGKWGGSMKVSFEADAALLAYVGDIIDATATPQSFAVRIRTTDASNILDIDFVGTVIAPPTLIPDEEGVVTVELDMVPQYGSNAQILSCWAAELTVP